MDRRKKYQKVHKLLFLREDVANDIIPVVDFKKSVTKVATSFLGNNYTELDEIVSDTLMGIVNMYDKLSFEDTRMILLDLMNDIDRGE